MIHYYPSEKRHTVNYGWLLARYSFSFADYYDPNNVSFGTLRVFNDDIIQPGQGFDMHPHKDMEILTYVIEGTLEHRDSMGNIGHIRAGELQRTTAGTGIFHSEYNASADMPVHSLQIWIMPRAKGLSPSWEQKSFSIEEQKNRLLPVVSGGQLADTLHIQQDAIIYLATLENGKEIIHNCDENRKLFLFCIKGSISLNDQFPLREGDSARITDTAELAMQSSADAQLLMIEMM